MSEDNLLEILQTNGDLNDVQPTTYMVMKEIPVKTWNCTKEQLQEECYALEHQFHRKANHIVNVKIPKLESDMADSMFIRQILKLPKTTPELTKAYEKAMEGLQNKIKLWKVNMSDILYKEIYTVLLPYCKQEFEEHIAICFKYPIELFTELRPMLDDFCSKINCTLGWDSYSEQFGIRPNLTTEIKRIIERGRNF